MGQNLKLHRLASGVVQDIPLVARATSTGVKSATQNVEFMQADTINLTVVSAIALDFQIGDYLEVCGDVYILNQLPTIKKTGKRLLEYTLVLEGISYQLIDTTFFMPFSVSIDALTGTVRDFLDVVITNLNRTHPNKWAVGSCISGGETKTITYQDQNCLQVLQDICNQFNAEFFSFLTDVHSVHYDLTGINGEILNGSFLFNMSIAFCNESADQYFHIFSPSL